MHREYLWKTHKANHAKYPKIHAPLIVDVCVDGMTTLILVAMLFIITKFKNLYTPSLYSQSHITATLPLPTSPFGNKKARHATRVANKQTITMITTATHPPAAMAAADALIVVTVVSTAAFAE